MIAVMFADIRSFTGIAETKLPYDLVFFLNSYFCIGGASDRRAGGMIDKFIGDGVMALFGVENGPEEGCRQALAAAQAMVEQVDALSRALSEESTRRCASASASMRAGGGGANGLRRIDHVTAIGDTVNVASRLQTRPRSFAVRW